jgi:Na+-transporting methylmalonyl-CoA/oxaloacetate decarboxylase gamma subunit
VQPAGPVGVSRITPSSVSAPALVNSSVIGPPIKAIGDWTIAEKLTAILPRAADSKKLSLDAQQQLKGMLSDPKFLAWVVGSLLVWFVSQFFVVGEILDMLLAGAALVLSGAGIFFALQSLVGAAHLIGRFVEVTRNAKTEKDLDAAADILAEIIVMIGITVLIAALTHATSRATSEGLQAKGSTIRRGPAEAAKPVERLPARSNLRPNAESAPDRTTEAPKADVVTRRAYLNEKFGRTGNLNQDINIRGNREIASGFFRSQGIPEEKIPGYLQGIDLSQPVTVETIGSGRSLYQYQPPGAPQGNWYSQKPNVSPDELGISPVGENRSAGTIEPKQLNAYQTSEPILVLRSTAAPVNDTWSVRGQSYPAAGGGTQLFSAQSPSIRPK